MAKHSRYTGRGNGKPLQYSCLDYLMNTMKWQNDMILKMSPLGPKVSNVLLRKSRRAIISSSRKNEAAVPGASTGDPTHDKVMWRDLMGQDESGLKGSSA